MTNLRYAVSAVALVAIAGCAGSAAAPPESTTVVPPTSVKAQVAVGTATLGSVTGMNVVATMRTPQGKSVLVSTPILTGPLTLPAPAASADANGATFAMGPSASESAQGGIISGTPQVTPGTPASSIPQTTFGIRGGLFADGFQPGNADNLGTVRAQPYPQPFYPTTATRTFAQIGGPPAYDPNNNGEGTRDGTFDPSILGVNEGINVFANVTPAVGSYNLRVLIPTTNGNTTVTTSTTLGAIKQLPAATAPTFVPDGNGGGSFDVVLPAGVSDGLVQIADRGIPDANGAPQPSCHQGTPGVVYYTIHVTSSGTVNLPGADGPITKTAPFTRTPSICTAAQNEPFTAGAGGDNLQIRLIGADYPLYGSNYLFNLNTQLPTITGSGTSDDITISPRSLQTST